MTLTVQSLGSGSSGNALLIVDECGSLLVDCGIGPRSLAKVLGASGHSLDGLGAILVTHEHVDHVRSLAKVANAGVPVISSVGTAASGCIPAESWEPIAAGNRLTVAGHEITALGVSHDAREPVGFFIRTATGSRIVVLTDLGRGDDSLVDPLSDADLIVIEANHDADMLRDGPYPGHLKRRVLSSTGHLSNADCAGLLARSLCNGRHNPHIWLAHLSTTNNRPQLAVNTVRSVLTSHGIATPIVALPRTTQSAAWHPTSGTVMTAIQMAIPGF